MIAAGALSTAGVWVRYAGTVPASPIYAVVLVGQILCSAAQTFILQVPPLIANEYVPRLIYFALTLLFFAVILGEILILKACIGTVGLVKKSARLRLLLARISINSELLLVSLWAPSW